ncbi:MAG TPA: SDR family oxidoreductase [Vicinamibacterales bacterium]|nr:SDR family oxidoreductase [Vicinamibacterales bacterium]
MKRFTLGMAAGVGAALIATRLSRARLAISFDGRVVVITGGSRGLGLVMARKLVDEGARVVLLARDLDELARAREELLSHGMGDVMTIRCDVRRRADVRAAVDVVLDRWRTIDVLINNAGIIQVGPLEHMDHEDFENAMATHFWGPLHLILEVAPVMRHRRFGRIVNISSIGGRIAVPHLAPYSASKFALTGLSDAVRAELDPYGIRVTTVAPGLMRTGSPVNAQFKGQHDAEYAWFKVASSIPGLTIAAERAAEKILEACRYGDPSLTITPQAKLAAAANAVAPAAVARVMMLITRALPQENGPAGNATQSGLQNEAKSRWTPSLVTKLSDNAALANNEV